MQREDLPRIIDNAQLIRIQEHLDKAFFLVFDENDLISVASELQKRSNGDFKKILRYLQNEVSYSLMDIAPYLKNTLNIISEKGLEALIFAKNNASKYFVEAINFYTDGDQRPEDIFFTKEIESSSLEDVMYAFDERIHKMNEIFENLEIHIHGTSDDDTAGETDIWNCRIFLYSLSSYFKMYKHYKEMMHNTYPYLIESAETFYPNINEIDKMLGFTNLAIKTQAHILAHEVVHLIEQCKIETDMFAHIMEENLNQYEESFDDIDPNVYKHCASFKLTLFAFSQYENSTFYVRPEFSQPILNLIKNQCKYEFIVSNGDLRSSLEEGIHIRDFGDDKELVTSQRSEFSRYAWERSLVRFYVAPTLGEQIILAPASTLPKTKNLDEAFEFEQAMRPRENYAKTTLQSQHTSSATLTAKQSNYIYTFQGEANLLKVKSSIDPFQTIVRICGLGQMADASLVKNTKGEAGLFMYLDQRDVKFIYVDMMGKSCDLSLEEAWWVLSL